MRRRLFISCISGIGELQGSSHKLIEQFVWPQRVMIAHPTNAQHGLTSHVVSVTDFFFFFLPVSKFRIYAFFAVGGGLKTKNICLSLAIVHITVQACACFK